MSLVDEFARMIAARGLGDYRADGSAGGDVYLTRMPPAPDAVLVVGRYGGPESDARLGYDEPGLQVRARGAADADITLVEDRAQAVYDALHGLSSMRLPLGTWLVSLVGVNGGPVYIGQDANRRDEYVVNFRAHLRRQTATRE